MPGFCGINHPRFTRLSTTHYRLCDFDRPFAATLHVGQIADFLQFDAQLHEQKGLGSITTIPLSFDNFAVIWNRGARSDDHRRLCQVLYPTQGEEDPYVILPDTPLLITNFFITAEQVGLVSDLPTSNTLLQNEIMQEFAVMMMTKQKNQ